MPYIDSYQIHTALERHYGMIVSSLTRLQVGLDPNARVFRVKMADGAAYFLKYRTGVGVPQLALVPSALVAGGVPGIVAPVPTLAGAATAPLADGAMLLLYPFLDGQTAVTQGLAVGQWREYGAILRRVHETGRPSIGRIPVPVETFSLPAAAKVRRLLVWAERAHDASIAGHTAIQFAAWCRLQRDQMLALLARAEALAHDLRTEASEPVLCHGDCHAANIMVGRDRRLTMIDWDSALLAPRERDLIFVIGSTIARPVLPREEAAFFAGYGPVQLSRRRLIYFRYERLLDDLGEFGQSVFDRPDLSEEERAAEAAWARGLLASPLVAQALEAVVNQSAAVTIS